MKTIILVLILALVAKVASATSPIIEPFSDGFARFEKTYPQRCAEVLREVQATLKPSASENIERHLKGMVQYVENFRYGTAEVRLALTDKNARIPFDEAVCRLVTDIVGFR